MTGLTKFLILALLCIIGINFVVTFTPEESALQVEKTPIPNSLSNIKDIVEIEFNDIPYAKDGWNLALLCINRPMVNPSLLPDDVRPRLFVVVNAESFTTNTDTTQLSGFSDWSTRPARVVVAQHYVENVLVWAHEFAHVLLEEPIHIYTVFHRCNFTK